MGSPPPLTAAFRAASFLFSLASVPARWPGRRYRLRYRPAPAPPPDPARPPPRRALRVNRNGLADPIGRRVLSVISSALRVGFFVARQLTFARIHTLESGTV